MAYYEHRELMQNLGIKLSNMDGELYKKVQTFDRAAARAKHTEAVTRLEEMSAGLAEEITEWHDNDFINRNPVPPIDPEPPIDPVPPIDPKPPVNPVPPIDPAPPIDPVPPVNPPPSDEEEPLAFLSNW